MVSVKVFHGVVISYTAFVVLVVTWAAPPDNLHGRSDNLPKMTIEFLGTVDGKDFFAEVNQTKSWLGARDHCHEFDLKLATIETENEKDFLSRTLAPYGLEKNYWTSARESRLPSMMVWDGTRDHPDTAVLPSWYWFLSVYVACVTVALYEMSNGVTRFDADVYTCSNNFRILCQRQSP